MPDVHYLTAEGQESLQKELAELKGPRRQEMSARLRAAIQQGDLSENADYIQAKEDQGFLEGRIQELEAILRNVEIIDEKPRVRGTWISARTSPFKRTIFRPKPTTWSAPKKPIPPRAASRTNRPSAAP